MAYQTPKTNWTASNAPVSTDFNRIEGNIAYLKGETDAELKKADVIYGSITIGAAAYSGYITHNRGHQYPIIQVMTRNGTTTPARYGNAVSIVREFTDTTRCRLYNSDEMNSITVIYSIR